MHPLRAIQAFARGESFWRVILTTGRVYSQLDQVDNLVGGKRALDWYRDLVAMGDNKRIAELWMHSPRGDVALKITEPGTAYQLNAAGLLLDVGMGSVNRSRDGQIIGRIEDRATGRGTAFIWDVPLQQMFKDESANVRDFQGWRPGIAPLGPLAIQNLGLML